MKQLLSVVVPCYNEEDALPYFKKDHTHTSMMGAKNNAKCVAKGLKKMKHPLAKYLK